MKPQIKKYLNVIVIDNFLPESIFLELNAYADQLDYSFAAKNKWQKQYDIAEPLPLEGPVCFSKEITIGGKEFVVPNESSVQQFIQTMKDHVNLIQEMIYPENSEWDIFGVRPFIYGRGSSLGWHTDGAKVGAYTYYLHKDWKPEWGGEFCMLQCESGAYTEQHSSTQIPAELLQHDVQQFFPKPNRLILAKGSAWHRVARIEAAAGNNLRRSISGFFFDSKQMTSMANR